MKPIISFIILLANVFTSTLVAAECTTSRNVDISITRPDSLYTDHGDGTVTDNATGLMWQKCSLGQAGSSCTGTALRFTWQAALAVANNNTGSGYTDWRLPSKNELASLVEDACRGPAINETVFPATIGFVYWSSSPYAGNSEVAWMVYFNGGGVATLSKNNNSSFVRLVRVTVTAAVPAVPTGLSPGSTNSPGSTLGGSTVTVSWNASSGASLYIGDVRDLSSGNSVGTINTGSTSATFSLSPGRPYRWWVEACNSTGCSSQSAFVYFQTQVGSAPAATIFANPTTVQAGGQTTLTWSSTNATSCTASNGWSGTKATLGSEAVTVQPTAGTENFGLSCAGNGQFVYTGVNVTVTAAAAVPTTPTGLSPGSATSPGSTLTSATVILSWNSSSGASLYIGDVRDFSSGNSVGTINTGSTSATFSLSPGKSYRWWVEACSSTGCSSQSAFVYFQTQADPAPTACTDPYEPNDSSGAAFPSGNYQLTKNYIYSAKICTATDVDWFKIYAATAGTISLTLAVPSGKDYDMELYTSSWVANGTNYGPGITDTLTFGATAGTWYYIRVLGYGDAFDLTASYSLSGTWP